MDIPPHLATLHATETRPAPIRQRNKGIRKTSLPKPAVLIQTNKDGGVKNLGLEAWYLWNLLWMVDRLIFWKGGRLENFSNDCRGIWDIHIFLRGRLPEVITPKN